MPNRKLTALYCHGLESNGLLEEKDNLTKYECEKVGIHLKIIAPTFNYKIGESGYDFYSNYLKENLFTFGKIDFIIGSSIGGKIAFHLSNKYKKPALLFNPAIFSEVSQKYQPMKIEKESDWYPIQRVMISELDDVVSPELLKSKFKKEKYKIIKKGKHRINPEQFSSSVVNFIVEVL